MTMPRWKWTLILTKRFKLRLRTQDLEREILHDPRKRHPRKEGEPRKLRSRTAPSLRRILDDIPRMSVAAC